MVGIYHVPHPIKVAREKYTFRGLVKDLSPHYETINKFNVTVRPPPASLKYVGYVTENFSCHKRY